MDRENWLKHNISISKELFNSKDDELVLVADGTYCYCQKSFNNSFQRKSFSVQKGRHLVQYMLVIVYPLGNEKSLYNKLLLKK